MFNRKPTLITAYQRFMTAPDRRISGYTLAKYHYDFLPFIHHHHDKRINKITEGHVIGWFSLLENARGLSQATLAKHRGMHRAFFNWCKFQGWIKNNPADSLPVYNDKPAVVTVPTDDTVSKAINQAITMSHSSSPLDRRDACIFACVYSFGNRRGEIKNLNVAPFWLALRRPIDLDGRTVYPVATTGKTGTAVALLGETQREMIIRYLSSLPDQSADGSLFINLDPYSPRYLNRLSDMAMTRARKKVLKKSNIDRLTYQDLRRWRGTQAARAGGVSAGAAVLQNSERVFRDFYYADNLIDAFKAAVAGGGL